MEAQVRPNKITKITSRRLLGLAIGFVLDLIVVLVIAVQPLQNPVYTPLALRILPAYPNAENVNTPSEASDLRAGWMSQKYGPPPALNILTFTTHDSMAAVLDYYTNVLQNEGWEWIVYDGGPKLWNYIPAPTDRWRQFAWPIHKPGHTSHPLYLLEVMAYPSEHPEHKGTTDVSLSVENGPGY